ncbi:MAG: DsbA family protein [Nanopusillaceae archaeon]|jgi:protein-disulfide isomerase
MAEEKNEKKEKEIKKSSEEKNEKSMEFDIKTSIIVGSIIIAAAVIAGSFIISNSISNIKIVNSSSSSQQNLLQTYLQTLPQVSLPNITNIDPVYGNPSSTNVVVYEYSDYACPYCDLFYLQTFGQIEQNYIDTGKISWVYIVFPLYTIHPYANITSQYLACVYELYGFNTWEEFANWSLYNQMQGISWDSFQNQTAVYDAFNQEAQSLGLDVNKIDQCVNNMQYYNDIYNQEIYSANTYGVDATPSFIVAVKTSSINYQQVQQVESVLNQLRSYGLSYNVFTTPDYQYIMFEFAGALPYNYFNQIFQPLTGNS